MLPGWAWWCLRPTLTRMHGQLSLQVDGRWVRIARRSTYGKPEVSVGSESLATIFETPDRAAVAADIFGVPAGWQVVSRDSGTVVLTETQWRSSQPEKAALPPPDSGSNEPNWLAWLLAALLLLAIGGVFGAVESTSPTPSPTTVSVDRFLRDFPGTEPSAEDDCQALAPNIPTPGGGDAGGDTC